MAPPVSPTIAALSNHIHFDTPFTQLPYLLPEDKIIVLTDENLMRLYGNQLSRWPSIVLPPGETSKSLPVVSQILEQLLHFGADRSSCLVGIGGGVISDLAGFVAAIYKRGIRLGIVPTTLLAMVDAAIGGKNGVNFSGIKNMIGTIRHPDLLIYDSTLLQTLPDAEWRNGFAEIIKHASILDENLFQQLAAASIDGFRNDRPQLMQLIKHNVQLKLSVVAADEQEHDRRKILNFGHTLGHAWEQGTAQLSHGEAVAMGMVAAAVLSEKISGFHQVPRLKSLIKKYGLPTNIPPVDDAVFDRLSQDKKMRDDAVDFILLTAIGTAEIRPLSLPFLRSAFSRK